MPHYGNVFGKSSAEFPAQRTPVWVEVKRQKLSGGTLDVSHNKKGDLIPLGVPVFLDEMGGKAEILDTFEVVSANETELTLKKGVYGTYAHEGMILMKSDEQKAITLGKSDDGLKFTVSESTSLSEHDKLVVSSGAESPKMRMPNGLSRRDIYIDVDVPTVATVAVVTDGQILADRIPEISEEYKAALTGISFEYESQTKKE